MQDKFSRRDVLGLGVSAAALYATGASAQSTIKAAEVPAPAFKIESGAKLGMLRPVKFVQPDEDIFRANAKRFSDKTGVEVKVDFVGWEDINQQTAVTSNSGAGPDLQTLRDVQAQAPAALLVGAGGLRSPADLALADQAGAAAWLVASALHDLQIPRVPR